MDACAAGAWRSCDPLRPISSTCDCVGLRACDCTPACYANIFCCIDIVDICPTLLAAPAGDAISDRVTRACTGWSEFPRVPENIGAAVAAARKRAAAAASTAPRTTAKLDDTSRTGAFPRRHAATDADAHRVDLWV